MRPHLLIILFLSLFVQAKSYAQNVKLVNATQQSWSGGIAGRHGDNYTFVIEFSKYSKEPVPDTLWIGQQPIALQVSDSGVTPRTNTVTISGKHSIRYEISAGTSANEYTDHYPITGNKKEARQPHAPIKCKGVALLSYQYNGRHHYFEISKIMKVFPPISYP
jgi:hypothetical protein